MTLLILTISSSEFEKKSSGSKTFGFFSNKLFLDLMFFMAYLILSKSNSSVKTMISISADNDFSPLRRYISNIVICLFNTLTSMKTGCKNINSTEKT